MGYLVCNKCGGTYELQEGESADDFDKCECGGKLNYKESIVSTPVSPKEKDIINCPKCGHKNLNNVKFCGSCGENLIKEKTNFKLLFKTLNFDIILIGSILTIIFIILSKILFFDALMGPEPLYDSTESSPYTSIYFMIIIIIGTFIVGTFKNIDYKKGALHGAIIMLFPALFFWVSVLSFYNEILSYQIFDPLEGISVNILFVLFTAILAIVFTVLGSIGTIIGLLLNKKLKLTEKNFWIKLDNNINRIDRDQWKFAYASFLITIILLTILSII